MNRATLSLTCLLPLASTFFGCAAETDKPSTNEQEIAAIEAALSSPDGGMTATAEAPMFSDARLAALSTLELPTTPDPEDYATTFSATLPAVRAYDVLALWGHLPIGHDRDAAETTPAPIDWTGAISVEKGALRVARTVKFDQRDALSPRTTPSAVSFVSHTLPRVDGVLLRVVVPADGSAVLHFDTAALSTELDLSTLGEKFGTVKPLGDDRNGVAFFGFPVVPGCERGFVLGKWGKVRPELGRMHGVVVRADGEPLGHVRGVWGHAPRLDKDLFFGKYIDAGGDFRGLFAGTYGEGELSGRWGTRDPGNAGTMEGYYGAGYLKADGKGVWISRWSERCAK